MHARVLAMSTFLKAGGDKDYGTVPKPPEESAQQAAIANAIEAAQARGAAPPAPQTPPTAQGPQKK